jgi:cytoskeleton protein RodZ
MDRAVGEVLREAREAQGVELSEVERVTKIRSRFLAAIEEERWDVLPGRAYATGFVRTYAEFLELDPAPLVAQLRSELEPGEHGEEVPPEPIVQRGTLRAGALRRIPGRLLAGLVGAAIAIAIVVLAISGGADPPEPTSGPPPAVEEAPEVDEDETDGDEPVADEPAPERAELALEAIGTVWVCVVDGRGDALVEGETLEEGDGRGPFEARRMRMTFGNGLIELTANGAPFEVPDVPDPLGFEVTVEGVEELQPPDRPTCA